jgi:hypothetical protein
LQEADTKEDDSKSPTTEDMDELRNRLGDLENMIQEMVRTGRSNSLGS